MASKKRVRRKEPDMMIANVQGVDFCVCTTRGKVDKVILPIGGGDTMTLGSTFLRGLIDMVDDIDGRNGE